MKYLPNHRRSGFTLIELSIVLVIIGLIVGGVLVGRDMIEAAKVRAQISQIGSYNAAVNVFRNKYGYLPGDLTANQAINFGFVPRLGLLGSGNGDGMIMGGHNFGIVTFQSCGEMLTFWSDLSSAALIPNSISNSSVGSCPNTYPPPPNLQIDQTIPPASIGGANRVVAYWDTVHGNNMYHIITLTGIHSGYWVDTNPAPLAHKGISPIQAFNIDFKMDDGYPDKGGVLSRSAISDGAYPYQGSGPGESGAASAGNCGSTDTTPTSYNLGGSFADSLVCSISIRMQ